MEKMIQATTTIMELKSMGVIGGRTFNSLQRLKITTVETILEYLNSGCNITDIRHLGKKSEWEINELMRLLSETKKVDKNDNQEETDIELQRFKQTPQEFQDLFLVTFNQYKEDVFFDFDTAWALFDALGRNIEDLLKLKVGMSKEENRKYRDGLTLFIKELIEGMTLRRIEELDICTFLQTRLEILEERIDKYTYEEELELLPEKHRKYLRYIYKKMVADKLSVRARNFIEHHAIDFASLVPLFDKKSEDYLVLCPGRRMSGTLLELSKFNSIFKEEFVKVMNADADEIELLRIKRQYPFLLGKQRQFIADFIKEYNYEPVFYLIYHCLRLSEDRDNKFRCLYYGIFDNERHSMDEIANLYNLSRERVRQILSERNVDSFTSILPSGELPQQYLWILKANIINEYHPLYKLLAEREKLPANFNVFACIVFLFTSFVIDEFKNKSVIISRSFSVSVKLSSLRNKLEIILFDRYSKDTQIDINVLLIDVPDLFKGEIRDMLFSFIRNEYGYDIDDNGIIFVPQNYIDIECELVMFLEEKGSPMTSVELFERFKSKYPEHKYTESDQLKSWIFRSERIGAIGKQSLYGLLEWSHLHYGTLKGLMEKTLSQSDVPMHISELYDVVLKSFPTAPSMKRLADTLSWDELDRFVELEGDMFGLSTKKYDSFYIEKKVNQRQNFNERILNFKEFVETYHRFPTSIGGEAETSLYRWLYNVQNGVLGVSEEEKIRFNELLQSYEGTGYPKTGTENEFLQNCNKYKDFIRHNHTLPSHVKGENLQQWYYRSKKLFDGFIDQRYAYMQDLFDFIASYGFKI